MSWLSFSLMRLCSLTAGALGAEPVDYLRDVFRTEQAQAAVVTCDLTHISVDLTVEVRRRASARTGSFRCSIMLSSALSSGIACLPETSPVLSEVIRRALRIK